MAYAVDGQAAGYREWENVLKARRTLVKAKNASLGELPRDAQIVACDSHLLIVPRVREYLEHEFKLDEPPRIKWCQY